MRHIMLTGPDNRLDYPGEYGNPLNALPVKCQDCGFPDLDHVPQPYYLRKSATFTPAETAIAAYGNFLVRSRVQQILELVAPDCFAFYPTTFQKTDEETPWILVVPQHQEETAIVHASIPRCPTCGEPQVAHASPDYCEWIWQKESDYDCAKSSTWDSSFDGWKDSVDRQLLISVRLFGLLHALGVKGMVEFTGASKKTKPHAEEKAWIQDQLKRLARKGVSAHAAGTVARDDAKRFRDYLTEHASLTAHGHDWKAIERSMKVTLPKSYQDFIDTVGPVSYPDVEGEEGFTVHILPPKHLELASTRLPEGSGSYVRPLTFARTDHGDYLCFDVRRDHREYTVYIYLHEYDHLEPYAPNFPVCIQRLTAGAQEA